MYTKGIGVEMLQHFARHDSGSWLFSHLSLRFYFLKANGDVVIGPLRDVSAACLRAADVAALYECDCDARMAVELPLE